MTEDLNQSDQLHAQGGSISHLDGLQHEAERRIATVLFVDIVGASGLGERLDVEVLQDIMAEFYKQVRSVLVGFGGTVGHYSGDAIMALFGVPRAHEDDVDRALSAAARLVACIDELDQRTASRYGERLAIHVGINTGEMVIPVGDEIDLGMVAADTVNIAARLQAAAGPREVLASDRTARAATRHVFTDRGEIELRGRRKAIHSFALVVGETRKSTPPNRAVVIGRAEELRVLSDALEGAVASESPVMVVVVGEAGIGKTALLGKFVDSFAAAANRQAVFTARCLPFGEEVALDPLVEMVRDRLEAEDPAELLPGDPAPVVEALMRQREREGAGDLDGAEATRLGRDVSAAWCNYFSTVTAQGPAVLLVEDVHWADVKLLDLLDAILTTSRGPLVMACTSRPEVGFSSPDWMTGIPNRQVLRLDPLGAPQAEEMLNHRAGTQPLADNVVQPLLAKAGGNPLFLEHLLDQLFDEKRIVSMEGQWQWARGGSVGFPDSIQAVLAARIDALGPFDALTLRYAAVVGQSFWVSAVALVHGASSTALYPALESLVQRNLVSRQMRSSLRGEIEYTFRHVLAREVAYSGLMRRERAAAHDLIYRWVESVAADRENVVDLLAHHAAAAFEQSSLDPGVDTDERFRRRVRALDALLAAAATARASASLDKAEILVRRCLAIVESAAEKATALEEWGRIALFGYLGDEAWARLRESIELRRGTQTTDDVDMASLCALALETPIRWPGTMRAPPDEQEAARYLHLGLAYAGRGDSLERTRLLLLKGFWHHAYATDSDHESLIGPEEALSAAEEATAMAHRLHRSDLESAALDGVAASWIPQGRYDRAVEATSRRAEIAPHLSDAREIGDIHAMGGWTNFHIGRYQAAFDYADAGYRSTADDVPSVAMHCLVWRSLARFHLADWDGQLADVAIAEELLGSRVDKPPHFVSPIFAAAALTHERRGNTGHADRLIEMLSNLDMRSDVADRDTVPLARWASWIARVYAHRGNFLEADALLTGTRWRRGTRLGLLLHAQCMIRADARRWDGVGALIERARTEARRGGLEALLAAVDHLEGSWLGAVGSDQSVVSLRNAAAGFNRCGAFWEEALSRRTLGGILSDAGETEAAASEIAASNLVFERVGAN